MTTGISMETFNNLKKGSLVHCITNYVTVNDVANTILASGGSPIMADGIEEVSEIVSICNSLVINIGTLHSRAIEAMNEAGKTANLLNKPVILDPVAIGASKFRSQTCFQLLDAVNFSVIRGNASEIKAILTGDKTSGGVDVSLDDIISKSNLDRYIEIAKEVSKIHESVVVITGPLDIVTDGKTSYIIKNGHENMEKITGTGCMLAGLIGAFVGANFDKVLEATVLAVGLMGLSGELANKKMINEGRGTSSLRTYLIDYISRLDETQLEEGLKIEIRK